MKYTISGVFSARNQAERAMGDLRARGFSEDQTSIVAREDVIRKQGQEGGMTMGDIGEGVTAGGAIGGFTGLLAGAGLLAVPGIGPIVAAGPLAAALSGAVTGGLAGGLLDYGIPEERGRELEQKVRGGEIVALIHSDENRYDEASSILRKYGASEVQVHPV